MVATWAISSRALDLAGVTDAVASVTAWHGDVHPALEPGPVLRQRSPPRRPSCTSACASTVAVVVPSPATSLVLVATSLTSCAPRFSYGSSSSISRAIVTPSLVMVGAPHDLSMTTLRPSRPEGHLDGVGQGVDAALEATPGSSRRIPGSWPYVLLLLFSVRCDAVEPRARDSVRAEPGRPMRDGGSATSRRSRARRGPTGSGTPRRCT